MTKVLIGGSRRIPRLNKFVKTKLDQIVNKGYTILVGDANGTDKSVQDYLSSKDYKNVIVYCMESACRNNIGKWNVQKVKTANNDNKKGFHYYSVKDLEMVKETDYGFLIWDAKSKGTLNNIINLLRRNKKVLLYFSPSKRFYTLTNFRDLAIIIDELDTKYLKIFESAFNISEILKDEGNKQALDSVDSQSKSIQLELDDLLFSSHR